MKMGSHKRKCINDYHKALNWKSLFVNQENSAETSACDCNVDYSALTNELAVQQSRQNGLDKMTSNKNQISVFMSVIFN